MTISNEDLYWSKKLCENCSRPNGKHKMSDYYTCWLILKQQYAEKVFDDIMGKAS